MSHKPMSHKLMSHKLTSHKFTPYFCVIMGKHSRISGDAATYLDTCVPGMSDALLA
jgi:hypothetical protein